MAELPRAQLSVSSELHTMARMRARARELAAKDAVWQGQLLAAGHPGAAAAAVAAAAAAASASGTVMPPPLPAAALTPPAASMHSPSLCASPVSPGEMSAPAPLSIRPAIAKNPPRPKRGAGKIRRRRLTKEEEARFPAEELTDLTGTTAARSRKMSREEHELMLHKRRLRNRESAARSRDRQRRTTTELAFEVDALQDRTRELAEACERASGIARAQTARANALERQNAELLAELAALRTGTGSVPAVGANRPPVPRPPPTLGTPIPLANTTGMPVVSMSGGTSLPMVNASAVTSMPVTTATSSGPVGAAIGLSTTAGVSATALTPNAVSSTALVNLAPGAAGMSTDTLDRLLVDSSLPPMSRATSLIRMPSWQTLRSDPNAAVHAPPGNIRKQNSSTLLGAFMDLDGGGAPSLSQDMASLLPAAAAPL